MHAGRRQRESQACALAHEELVRNLDQDAGAVAGLRIAAARSAVRQVDQNLNSLDDDIVRLLAADVGDKPDTAGVAFVGGVVKTLRRWQTEWDNRVVHSFVRNYTAREGSPAAAWFNPGGGRLRQKCTSIITIRQ